MATPTKRTVVVGSHPLAVISFIDRRPPNANPQWGEFLAQYQLEDLLYRTHFNTTGAVYRLLKRAGVSHQALALRRTSVADGLLSDEEFDQLKELLDSTRLRSFTLIPLDAVQAAVTAFGSAPVSISLLTALGMPQPAGWVSSSSSNSSGEAEARVEGAQGEEHEGEEQDEEEEEEEEEGGEVEDDDDDEGEGDGGHASSNGSSGSGSGSGGGGGGSSAEGSNARSRSHDGDDDDYPPTEVESEAEVVGGDDEEEPAAQRRSPAIAVSPKLQTQLEAFERHRSATINRHRRGKAVAKITVASDRRSILHFLAWVEHEKGVAGPSLGVFASPKIGRVVEEFVEEKQLTCKHARVANLLGSLVSAARFAHAVLAARAAPGKTVSAAPLNELVALHTQSLAEARKESKFSVATKPKAWLDWSECQRARVAAEKALGETKGDSSTKLTLTRDVCLLRVLTGMPPDRVGVYRQLRLGGTLKSVEDGYQLDLSLPGEHKTASFFGPACTTVTAAVSDAIAALVTADELQDGEFLFHASTNRRAPLDTTAWGRLVKATFKAYSDVGLCPKDCRASFVTWLRSGEHGDDVLTGAARQMRHSSQMSESATYDKEKAARVVSAASKAADAFALRFA